MKHMPQLDGLRAVAILLVLVQHFSPPEAMFGSRGVFPLGFVGVDLFFVLSGYLISRILLAQAQSAEPVGRFVWRFIVRRALRLFPLYYAVLVVAVVFDYQGVRQHAGWMFSYTSNFLSIRLGEPVPGFTQFWSLAVEEQFYLFWPWLILLTPRAHLPKVFVLMLLSGPVGRGLAAAFGGSALLIRYSSHLLLDLFAAGAVLAWLQQRGIDERGERLLRLGFWTAAGVMAVALGLRASGLPVVSANETVLVPFSFVGALIWARVIHACSKGTATWAGRVLAWRPMVYIGQISYGIYVLHNFVEDLAPPALATLGLDWPRSSLPNFVLLTALTVALAALSWTLIEKPINSLKQRWSPAGSAADSPAAAPPASSR